MQDADSCLQARTVVKTDLVSKHCSKHFTFEACVGNVKKENKMTVSSYPCCMNPFMTVNGEVLVEKIEVDFLESSENVQVCFVTLRNW